MSDIKVEFEGVLNGSMAIGHRPKLKKIGVYKDGGATHIWTLLSEKEGALDIRKAVRKSGLEWVWLPLANGKPPEDTLLPDIAKCFSECKELLANGAQIYLHCSAGIHRTGMISYAFLRYLGLSEEDSLSKLQKMRALTHEGVGADRMDWGELNFGSRNDEDDCSAVE